MDGMALWMDVTGGYGDLYYLYPIRVNKHSKQAYFNDVSFLFLIHNSLMIRISINTPTPTQHALHTRKQAGYANHPKSASNPAPKCIGYSTSWIPFCRQRILHDWKI